MPSLITIPIFPLQPFTYPGFSVRRRPTFSTTSISGKQGREVQTFQQDTTLWEFELTYEVLRDETQNVVRDTQFQVKGKDELQQLLEFYLACGGPYGEFLFWDSTDNSRAAQFIGDGDGTITLFPFIRSIIGDNQLTYSDQVGAVNIDQPIIVYINGSPVAPGPSTWTVSADLLSLVFTSAPAMGDVIAATFEYYYRCAWMTEEQDFEEFAYNWWSSQSVKFRAVNPTIHYVVPPIINPINPPVPPTPIHSNCLLDFQWWNTNATFQGAPPGNQAVDVFGNFYMQRNAALTVYNTTGNPVQTYTQKDLADKIDSWYGSPIVIAASSTIGFPVKPIMQGTYMLAFLGTMTSPIVGTSARWWAVLQPNINGSLDVLGACYTATLRGPPYTGVITLLDVANDQTTSDPILFIAGTIESATTVEVVGVLPSIDDMTGKITGYDPFHPLRIPSAMFFPISTFNLSQGLFLSTPSSANPHGGFILPNDSGETILYIYLNRVYMDSCAANSIVIASAEVKSVLQPVYPHGCILKINLGVVDFGAIVGSVPPGTSLNFSIAVPTPSYSVDNANWVFSLGGLSILPLVDEYTYISLGNNIGGTDAYSMQPACIVKRPSGKWWLIFYMLGFSDAIVNNLDKVYDAFRVIEWDPATEVGLQIVQDFCVLHTFHETNYPSIGIQSSGVLSRDLYQGMTLVDEIDGTVTIIVHGCVYLVNFYNWLP